MDYKFGCKKLQYFYCKNCDFTTSQKWRYDRHLSTDKHKKEEMDDAMDDKKVAKSCNPYFCKCGKDYKHRQGLWKHQQKCKIGNFVNENEKMCKNETDKEQIIMTLIQQNYELIKETNEFKNIMLEVIKNGTNNITHTNSHNNSFNLNFFLNETCKNAMNITDFIDSLHLQIGDLEGVGELGYVDGISNIIINNLNALDVTERPIHCTDKKRETMYVKDEDKWEKEDEQKIKMHRMVRKIANKNINLIPEFQELHPEYKKISSKYSDQYNKIIIESMGGKGENEYDKEEKIIKKVAREVVIDK
jgi:hypothetical protein